MSIGHLKIKIFADGADLNAIREAAKNPLVSGFTTNPSLMRSAGISDYEAFARSVVNLVPARPVSFEVLADDLDTICEQARTIAGWGDNIFVKIPVSTTRGESTAPIVSRLSSEGIKLNITAIMTHDQVIQVTSALSRITPALISVFAGRIADTGRDPTANMARALAVLRDHPRAQLLWASPREVLNIFQADEIGCHVITLTNDLLRKLPLVGKDLDRYSVETVEMFYKDAVAAGYSIRTPVRHKTAI
jgi:transaldolase